MSTIVSLISSSDLFVAAFTSDINLSASGVATCFGSGETFFALMALSASSWSRLMPRCFITNSSNDITSASTLSMYCSLSDSSE